MKKKRVPSIIIISLTFIFLYLPIVVMMFFSFNSAKSLTHFESFSLRWYERLINDGFVMKSIYVSLSIAIFATIISVFLGTLTAIGLSKSRNIIRKMMLNINDIPILNPDIVTAIGLMIFFSSAAMEKGYITMLLAHVLFCTPFVITSVYPRARSIDPSLIDAALDLGATPFTAFSKVMLPMLKDSIYASVLLAFTMSFDDFIISYFVTGNGVSNISITVYNMTKRTNPTINALSTLVIVAIVVLIILSRIISNRFKKKKNAALLGFILLGGLLVLTIFTGMKSSQRTLRVYNAGEYIEPTLLQKFEEENGCKVVYETFDSNESMYTKLMSGSQYDVLIPSDYMIGKLIEEDMLLPVDKSEIPNYENIDPSYLGLSYDPDNTYSVPYFVGNVGILYNKDVVDEEDLSAGWELLKNEKYKGRLYMYDSERDSFMVALKALGYSMNTTDRKEIDEAYDWLIEQRNTMDVVYAGDDVIDNMISGNKDLAVVYSGDAAMIIAENEDLDYFVPEEGTNEWCDAMVITKDCTDTSLALSFMDFVLDYDNALVNTAFVGYTSPIAQVNEELAASDYEGIDAFLPEFGLPNDETFAPQDLALKEYIAELWTKVKSY